jgi:hypothetical protein
MDNPYAAPEAAVAEVGRADDRPLLWNPSAAASWSLLFSPVFGAWLHMRNWRTLGDPTRAAQQGWWIVASVVVMLGLAGASIALPENKALDGLSRTGGLGLLLAWYFASAKPQARLVKERYGEAYARRGWGLPLLLGVLGMLAFFVAAVVMVMVAALVFNRPLP